MTTHELQIRNIVATGNLKMRIDLYKLATNAPLCVKYNASRLNAAIMKITTPNKATCLIFGNGKIVCTGTNAIDKAMRSMEICARRIKMALGLWKMKMKVDDFKIQNIISTFSVGHQINLYKFHSYFKNRCTFEPELFPGLSYKYCKGVSAQLFCSGKIVITGPKSFTQMNDVFNEIDRNIELVYEFEDL
jgi:transcription initiation factor TFIID TATA-box-binding protein